MNDINTAPETAPTEAVNDRVKAAHILSHYFETAWRAANIGWTQANDAEMVELVNCLALELDNGKPGTGVCVCSQSPIKLLRQAKAWHMAMDDRKLPPLVLDHRCAWHGVEAQPKLWGRNRGAELVCAWLVWESLGVRRGEDA